MYKDFEAKPEFGLYNCHNEGTDISDQQQAVFTQVRDFSDDTLGDKFYFTQVGWCKYCADDYISKLK